MGGRIRPAGRAGRVRRREGPRCRGGAAHVGRSGRAVVRARVLLRRARAGPRASPAHGGPPRSRRNRRIPRLARVRAARRGGDGASPDDRALLVHKRFDVVSRRAQLAAAHRVGAHCRADRRRRMALLLTAPYTAYAAGRRCPPTGTRADPRPRYGHACILQATSRPAVRVRARRSRIPRLQDREWRSDRGRRPRRPGRCSRTGRARHLPRRTDPRTSRHGDRRELGAPSGLACVRSARSTSATRRS